MKKEKIIKNKENKNLKNEIKKNVRNINNVVTYDNSREIQVIKPVKDSKGN